MASGKKVLKQKIKKKKWYPVYAPKTFNNSFVGETYLDSVDNLKGKYLSVNLSTIVNDMKKQHINITLRVNRVIEGAGHSELIGLKVLQGHLKRLVRRGRTKVEDSFSATTKDAVLVRIKPIIITSNAVKRPVATEIRTQTKQYLTQLIQSQGFIATFEDILSFRVQKGLKQHLSKITPLRTIDVRIFEREVIRGTVPDQELSEEIPKRERDPAKKVPVKKKPVVEAESVEDEVSGETSDEESITEDEDSDDEDDSDSKDD